MKTDQANQKDSQTIAQEESAEQLTTLFNETLKDGGSFTANIKGEGTMIFLGGKVEEVLVQNCWAYFKYRGRLYRTETTEGKEALLLGNLSVTLVRIGAQNTTASAVEPEKVQIGFIPRSRHSDRNATPVMV